MGERAVIERYYQGLKEIKRATTEAEANVLITQGWELLKPVEIEDPVGRGAQVHYVMGRTGATQGPGGSVSTPRPSSGTPPAVSVVDRMLGLPWEESKLSDAWVPAVEVPKEVAEYMRKGGLKTDKGNYVVQAGNFDIYLYADGSLRRYKPK